MTLATWLSLVAICCLGAISPGPSLAVILRNTVNNGRTHGILTALTHAVGLTVWALLTIWGLAIIVIEIPLLYKLITYLGAAYLAWMGVKAIRSSGGDRFQLEKTKVPLAEAARDGLMISLLNPKLAIFFIALFSQFVSADLTLTDQLIMLSTVVSIDSTWYITVAIVLSRSGLIGKLQQRSGMIDKVSGVVLVGLALRVATLS